MSTSKLGKSPTYDDFGSVDSYKRSSESGGKVAFRPLSSDVTLDTPIFRYIKLEHLFTLLQSKKLYIPNRKTFTDLRDKVGIEKFIPTEKMPWELKLAPSCRNKKYLKEQRKIKEMALDLCISCWSMDLDDNHNAEERFLMWKAYGSTQLCCRIRTTIRKLIENVIVAYDIIVSDVSYDSNRKADMVDRLIFNKSAYYRDEQEVRLVVMKTGLPCVEADIIQIVDFIDEIKLSPFLIPALEDSLSSSLRSKFKEFADKIVLSKVMEYPL